MKFIFNITMPENKLDQFPHQLLHEHHDPSRKTLENRKWNRDTYSRCTETSTKDSSREMIQCCTHPWSFPVAPYPTLCWLWGFSNFDTNMCHGPHTGAHRIIYMHYFFRSYISHSVLLLTTESINWN